MHGKCIFDCSVQIQKYKGHEVNGKDLEGYFNWLKFGRIPVYLGTINNTQKDTGLIQNRLICLKFISLIQICV